MRTSFQPKLDIAVTAHLISGAQINNHLYRFKAVVSSKAAGWQDAVISQLGSDLTLVEEACIQLSSTDMGTVIEGFAKYAPSTHVVAKSEFASHCENNGLVHLSKNMYMDADERIWEVREAGADCYISKTGNDDVEALLASVNRHASTKDQIKPLVTASEFPGAARIVNDAGELVDIMIVSATKGDNERFTYLELDNLRAQAQVASVLQVVAYEDLQHLTQAEDFENYNPLDYWREVYSDDPEMVQTLKENMKL